MNTGLYSQLITDIQSYIRSQVQLLQLRSIEERSRLIGMMITIIVMTTIIIIGLIFLAIALAAWLEQWLPMWASYLVVAGAMGLVAVVVYMGRRIWFVRPVERHLCETTLGAAIPLQKQMQSLEDQAKLQRELLSRDMAEIQRDWSQVRQLLTLLRDLISPKK